MITPGPFVASWPKEFLRQPGIEPGSIAWEATMLTITPLTQRDIKLHDDVAFNKRIHVEKNACLFHLAFRSYNPSSKSLLQQRRWCKG